MNILHIIVSSIHGGAEKVFVDYIKILKKLGHKNYAVIKSNAPYENKIQDDVENIFKINNYFGHYDIFAINKIFKSIKKNHHKIDVVVAHSSKAISLSCKALKKIKTQKIVLVAVNHSNNVKRSLMADLILSVNRQIFYKTIDLKRTPENSLIMYNAIEIDENLKPNLEKYNFKNKPQITLGVIGRMHKIKAFDLAIDILDKLNKSSNYNFILKIAGSGEEKENLIQQVKQLKLNDKVEFLGWVEDSKDFFAKIDIFLLPSSIETFGLVILESMKNFVPVIATKCHGPEEIIRENIDGLLIENKHKNRHEIIDEFAKNIVKIIENEDLSKSLVSNAYNRLLSRFSYKILEKNLSDIFK
jgi:glycosyltransferase involved in cell wall biosynthesis